MVKILADAMAPIFAGLLLGYIAGLRGVLVNQNVRNLIVFVMSFAVPCSMFLSIAQTPRAALGDQTGAALVRAIVYFVLFAATFVWARSSEKLPASDSSVLALTISFPNSAAVGLPLLAVVYGAKSLDTVATSIALGLAIEVPLPVNGSYTMSPASLNASTKNSKSARGNGAE